MIYRKHRAATRAGQRKHLAGALSIGVLLGLASVSASAQAVSERLSASTSFDIPAQPLGLSLKQLAYQAGIQILFEERVVRDVAAPAIKAHKTAAQALHALLAGTGLEYTAKGSTIAVREKSAASAASADGRGSSTATDEHDDGSARYLRIAQAQVGGAQPAAAKDSQEARANTEEPRSDIENVLVLGSSQPFKPTDTSVGTKIAMDVAETPQSITIISRELMDMVAPQNVGEVATLAPGVRNGERDVSTIFDVSARGFPVTYSRGFRINTMPFTNNGILIDFDSVERVEVIRGPSSIIYGQADYGTTVNTALKRPKTKALTETAFTLGSYDYLKAATDVSRVLSDDGSVRGRAVVSYEDRNSRTDYVGRDLPSIYTALDWDLADNTLLELTAFYNKSNMVTNYGFSLTADGRLPNVSRSAFQGTTFNGVELMTAFAMASLTHDFNDRWSLKAMASYAENEVSARESFISGRTNSAGEANFLDFYVDDNLETSAADLTLTGEFDLFGQSHTLMLNGYSSSTPTRTTCCYQVSLGMFDIFDPTQPEQYVGSTPPSLSNSSVYTSSTARNTDELAFGGLLLLHPMDRVTVMAGARWTHYDTRTNNLFSGARISALKDSAVTPRFGVVYDMTHNVNVYASYSEGVIFQSSRKQDGSLLGPEEGTQWEFGTKGNLIGDKVFFGLAWFQIDRSNVAVSLPLPNPEGFVRGIDGQRHRGVELEFMGEPLPGWNLFGSFSYLDVEVTESANAAEVGRPRANSPKHQLKLYSNYEFRDGALDGLTLGGGVMYFSERMIDNFGTYEFAPYARVDLSLSYAVNPSLRLSLNGMNVLDKKIPNSICGATGSANCGIIYQDPRTFYARVAFSY